MRSVCCDKCNGEGVITTRDPKDAPGVLTYTTCTECNGQGWYEYLKGLLVLIVPSALLFLGGGA